MICLVRRGGRPDDVRLRVLALRDLPLSLDFRSVGGFAGLEVLRQREGRVSDEQHRKAGGCRESGHTVSLLLRPVDGRFQFR